MGRVRDVKWGPRVIDLDLIVYGDQVINSDFLNDLGVENAKKYVIE